MPLEDYEDLIKKCLRCSICKWIPQILIKSQKYASVCPAIDMYNFHQYSGGGKNILAYSLLLNRMEPSKELADVVFKCTTCGGCAMACKYLNNLEPLEVIMELRELLVEKGLAPMDKQQKYGELVQQVHNPYGEEHGKRLDWIPDDVKITKGAKLIYYVGCTSAYRRKEIAINTARILNRAGIEFDILEDEQCCGSPLLRTGQKQLYEKQRDHNIKIIEDAGAEEVIMSCAGCLSTFKAEYARDKKYNFKVLHASELFDKLIDDGVIRIKKEIKKKVTYHDPCHLGRCSEPYEEWNGKVNEIMPLIKVEIPPKPIRRGAFGIYEPPRNILKKIPGIEFNEMERIKEYSYCCGAGGGVKAQYPEFALKTAINRLDEAKSTGAEALVSSCPFCETNFKDAIEANGEKIEYIDICQLLLEAMED
ncbi:MAG: (Fe-S)-binding protein [Candidatus Helarchaeota archaeon]